MVRRVMRMGAEDDQARAMATTAVTQVNAALLMANTAISDGAVDRQSLRQMVATLQGKVAALEVIANQAMSGELDVIVGPAGANGREVELRVAPSTTQLGQSVQWRYSNDLTWHDLAMLETLRGPAGQTGADGGPGPRGLTGDTGQPGADGLDGADGIPGLDGQPGERGVQGLKGDTGTTGLKGDQGERGIQGERGATGLKGDTGAAGVKGDQGERGLQGLQGLKGDTGTAGVKGDQGLQGLKGDTGAAGVKGDQGLQGVKGDTGTAGAAGVNAAENQRVGIGLVPALALGASADVTVTWDTPMPSAIYNWTVATGALIGQGTVTYKSKTASTITFTVKSTAFLISANTVFVVVAWSP